MNNVVELFRQSDIRGADYRPFGGNYVIVKGDRVFASYERFEEDQWIAVRNAIPNALQRIRSS